MFKFKISNIYIIIIIIIYDLIFHIIALIATNLKNEIMNNNNISIVF